MERDIQVASMCEWARALESLGVGWWADGQAA